MKPIKSILILILFLTFSMNNSFFSACHVANKNPKIIIPILINAIAPKFPKIPMKIDPNIIEIIARDKLNFASLGKKRSFVFVQSIVF